MKLRLTRFERSWIGIFGLLAFVITAIILIQPVLNKNTPLSQDSNIEPLADAASLQELILGHTLPQPDEISDAVFHGTKVNPPQVASLTVEPQVLGVSSEDKHIEVDLANQKVYAFEGSNKVYDFTVSTGKWGRTPTGEFHIWVKVRSQGMSGGNAAIGTYYNLPNVPYVEFFYNAQTPKSMGYSFHGTYWHNNFGHPMSHGCINMRTADAKTLFEWTTPTVTDTKAWSTLASAQNPGTRVVIYGEAPKE
jgi:lipoprotein-anchoring transpeptidase ErfK/SrfK